MNKKATTIKVMIVIILVLGALMLPGAILVAKYLPANIAAAVYQIFLILFLGYGLTFLILSGIFLSQDPHLLRPAHAKPDHFPIPFSTYESFLANLLPKLSANGYQKHTTVAISDGCEITIFFGSARFSHLDCFVLIHSQEFLAEWENPIQEALSQEIHQLFSKKILIPSINLTALFCLDHSSADFRKRINHNTQQYRQFSQFFAGFVFEEETLYIARQVDGFAPLKYKKLRKKFLKMIDLPTPASD